MKCEFLVAPVKREDKPRVAFRWTAVGWADLDDAMKMAETRACEEGRVVRSANFVASADLKSVDRIVVYVKE